MELYIIEAIKEGLIVAKLDQFQETVAFKKINLRALRKEDYTKLQNELSAAANHLRILSSSKNDE